jgi:UDP-glucuronate 4-epimerase
MAFKNKIALVTGSAGFIGYHTAKKLLDNGWAVLGIDCLSDYYDVELKKTRQNKLLEYEQYTVYNEYLEKPNFLYETFSKYKPELVIHLAAQAGVRYSIDNPRSYLESNIVGVFELLEAARAFPPEHMMMASTSSAYGANTSMPFEETQKADHQMSFYAATKKANEIMAHSYSHLYGLPITMFRFFTVYGPWGRPDMALFKFTKAIREGKSIDVYNNGKMRRDFTYIDDLVQAIFLLASRIPGRSESKSLIENRLDSLSPVAPHRIVNIGNSQMVELLDFINEIELYLKCAAEKNMMPMQAGDVKETSANTDLLFELTKFKPNTSVRTGIRKFVDWYLEYYHQK